ncbi:MAG: CPBP family intramembrane metalloprotease [Paracoccus sp. (in: a-proteobacteria)]|nr:CPBP family intramembrane metalloprotease [Paracoccus sp. (in: a-proteobacteria)]
MTPFARYIAPARRSAQLWRVVVVLIVVAVGSVMIIAFLHYPLAQRILQALAPAEEWEAITTMMMLTAFWVPVALLIVMVGLLHRRGPGTLFGPDTRQLFRDFRRVAIALLLLNLVIGFLLPGDEGGMIEPGLAPDRWLVWVLPALIALVVQVTAEEVVFRGYIQQQMAARFGTRGAWLVFPSILFAALHVAPDKTLLVNVETLFLITLMALAMADLTARAGNLGPALAVHLINNIWAVLLISDWQDETGLNGLALFLVLRPEPSLTGTAAAVLMLLIGWLGARLALRR